MYDLAIFAIEAVTPKSDTECNMGDRLDSFSRVIENINKMVAEFQPWKLIFFSYPKKNIIIYIYKNYFINKIKSLKIKLF